MRLFFLISISLIAGSLHGQALFRASHPCCDRYVSNTGSDAADGKTPTTAWQTIAKVNAATLTPYQQIGFKSGGTWRETLTSGQSGATGAPITFTSYGVGTQPIIDGSNLLTSFTTQSVTPGTDLTTGHSLAGWYRFQSAGNLGLDSSGSSNTLTPVASPTQTTGPNANVPSASNLVAASSQYYSISNTALSATFPGKSTNSNKSFSLSIWLKPADQSVTHMVLQKGCAYGIQENPGGSISFVIFDSGFGFHSVDSTAALAPGVWSHVVATWASVSGTLTLYVNGTSTGTPATSASDVQDTGPLGIGQTGSGCFGGPYFDGGIAEPGFFNQTLTSGDISSLYQFGMNGGGTFNVYYATGNSTNPLQVLEDDARTTEVSAVVFLTPGTYAWDSADNRIYIRTFQDALPAGHIIEAAWRSNALNVNNVHDIAIAGLETKGAQLNNVRASGAVSGLSINSHFSTLAHSHNININTSSAVGNILLANNTSTYAGASGIEVVPTNLTGPVSIKNNSVDHNAQIQTPSGDWLFTAGIEVFTGAANGVSAPILISGNTSTNQASNVNPAQGLSSQGVGIWCDTCNYATVTGNYTANNWGTGLHPEKNAQSTWAFNVSNHDDLYGINTGSDALATGGLFVRAGESTNSDSVLITNNTVYNTRTPIRVQSYDASTITHLTLTNNIAYGAASYAFYGGAGANGTGNTYTFNNFGLDNQATLAFYNGAGYSTYATLQTALGYTTHNTAGNPLFVNAAAGDFNLQTGSPAIGTGVFISGVSTANPPNIGAK